VTEDWEVHCHASDSDGDGIQHSCGQMAWSNVPWSSARGDVYEIPLCFNHLLRYVRKEHDRKPSPGGEVLRTALELLAAANESLRGLSRGGDSEADVLAMVALSLSSRRLAR